MTAKVDVYQELRTHIDRMPIAYPETESGVEISLLKQLFTPDEAEIALELSAFPEPLGRIHKRLRHNGMTREQLEHSLDAMVKKGAITGGAMFEKLGKGKCYSKAQLAIGMFEYQVNRLTPDLIRDFRQYIDKEFFDSFFREGSAQMRTVPIAETVSRPNYIAHYDDMKEYIKNLKGDISVMNCVCSQEKGLSGEPCARSSLRETCIGFHEVAKFFIGKGEARPISKEEALTIIDQAEKEGFVLQPENTQNPRYLCCCCPDCCNVLQGLRRLPRPASFTQSGYQPSVNEAQCNGCGQCEQSCPMNAVTVKFGLASVDSERCIGCGVCATRCGLEAIELRKKPDAAAPPKNSDNLYLKIVYKRFGIAGTMKIIGRALLGMKV
ncbi:MAG TPA: 4Fe-4S binding protein [Spirochaetota bacterium]|nr:4Fe-4S binding protein [Spirochaetota bacterium]HPI88969.1 4Fe-4S binding protein [Spirochaetota bacterium]HPR47456.1 4Fe-4S binding protein [Spirochaetota bacterium]